MPEINPIPLQRAVRRDYALEGVKITWAEAEKIVTDTINDGLFKKWLAQIDEYDFERGLTDIDGHSDTTGRRAIMRVLRAQFKQAVAA